MYPRNSASPERISVGQVVLISDGTIQTASIVITVRGQGGAESVGSGTTDYGADGTVYYTPTQAETNYTSFIVIASKALCFSCSQTIITSASTTSGKVVLSSEIHAGATIPDVTLVATTTNNIDMVDISNLPTTAYLDTRTLLSADYFIVGDYTPPNTVVPLSAAANIAAIDAVPAATLVAGSIDTYNLQEALRIILAAMSGNVAGGGTASMTLRAADNSKVRISADTDVDGNRSNIVLDAT